MSGHNRIAPLLVAILLILGGAGCDQPIYDVVVDSPTELALDLVDSQDAIRHDWPIRGTVMAIAKPPPMAYLTSYQEPIQVAPLNQCDPKVWQSPSLSEPVRTVLQTLLSPLPTQIDWSGNIPAQEFVGAQGFDLSIDGKRLVTITPDQHFALYNTADGRLIGKRELPGDWSDAAAMAIRFAPQSNDFLVASTAKICRISSQDGAPVGEIEGPGEPIKKWLVADDDSYMLMLTESGKLFGGDPDLQRFEVLELEGAESQPSYHDVGMSFDGVRILVTVDQRPRTYLQESGRIVDFVEYPDTVFDQPPTICGGARDDFWATPKTAFFTRAVVGPNSNAEFGIDNTTARKIALAPEREPGTRSLFWQPAWLNPVRESHGKAGEWAIGLSRRPHQGKWQWVIHDINIRNRFNSVARPLDHKPDRFIANRFGSSIAVADQSGLHLANWIPWRTRSGVQATHDIGLFFTEGDLDDFEATCQVLHDQDYWSHIGSSSDFLANLLRTASTNWAVWLERQQLDGDDLDSAIAERLKVLEQWHQQDGFWARTVHANLLHRQSWRAREAQDGLGGDRFTRYRERRVQAMEEMKALIDNETRPCSLTLMTYVGSFLESSGQLEEVDAICRRTVDLFPLGTGLAQTVGFKLVPQWHGEVGDMLSYLLSHSRMYELPFAGHVYAESVGYLGVQLDTNAYHWRSFDPKLMGDGIDLAIEQGMSTETWFFNCQSFYKQLKNAPGRVDQMANYIMQTNAVVPQNRQFIGGQELYADQDRWERLLGELE
ncbi:hypothetical protein NHH03_14750 [Stieleria sp. TO1_6]|uniref:hypothetical protein n=1 Tax=Stieleria tagensis TaxID=2956795 RepID=UPI00209A87B5|nr:hypothetical protein [Stieleria tagensis]MCO8123005.1 hypothetical protein [Stieleria tagensis]